MTNNDTDTPSQPPTDPHAALPQVLAEAGATGWPTLIERMTQTREQWNAAAAGLTADEADNGPRDADWTARDIGTHVLGTVRSGADALATVAVAGDAHFQPGASALWPGADFEQLRNALASAWSDLIAAAGTVAKQPSSSRSVAAPMGELSPRQLVGIVLWHAGDHVNQMRNLRQIDTASGPTDPSP